jgi:hypothetical protein
MNPGHTCAPAPLCSAATCAQCPLYTPAEPTLIEYVCPKCSAVHFQPQECDWCEGQQAKAVP